METRRLGRRVLVYDQVDSTNIQAAALAHDPANDGVVLLAREQTGGRGQHGRSWLSDPDTSVLLSVLIFPPLNLRRPVILAAWAANSVCETVRQLLGLQAKIKWPNDVLLRGRKVCGILIEQASGVVVGIGLNVNQTRDSFAAAGLPQAGSLAMFAGRPLDCSEVARTVIGVLDEEYDRLHQGDWAALESCWKWRTGLLGKQVMVECTEGMFCGRLRELSWEALELELDDQETRQIQPESVRHITAI